MPAPLYVLSGGPCSGKTTLLERLGSLGHPVISEAATEVRLDPACRALRDSPLEFQREVLRRQLEKESNALERAEDSQVVFADRGVGDHFGYLRHHGIEPFAELLQAWGEARTRYRAVFFLAMSPKYKVASHRQEGPAEATRVHECLRDGYTRHHPEVIRVPWLPIRERLDMVLDWVRRLA